MKKYNYFIDASTTRMGIVLEDTVTKKLLVTDLSFMDFKRISNEVFFDREVRKLGFIHKKLENFTKKYPVGELVVMEGIYINPGRRYSSDILLKLHGMLIEYFMEKNVPEHNLIFIPPAKIKKAITGKGNASKKEVSDKIRKKYINIDFENNDQSDAFAVYLTYEKLYKYAKQSQSKQLKGENHDNL